jgi:hypothetical protein
MFHEQGQIDRIEHVDGGMKIHGKIPGRFVSQFSQYLGKDEIAKLE